MIIITDLTDAQRAEARGLSYQLFADIFLRGVTADMLPVLSDLPGLAVHLEGQGSDERAAAHYGLFGLNVPPYTSIFLSDDLLLGGAVSEAAQGFYAQTGFAAATEDAADHIGVELGLLAFLSGAEVDALADSVTHEAARMRHWQRRFLDEHLLWWLPGLAMAIRGQGDPFYAAIAQLTLELALDHRRTLGDDLLTESVPDPLPEPPDNVLEDEKTSLKDIARFLLTPAHSGFYLSREDVAGLARKLRMPCGFGDRLQMLTNLFHTAADHDSLPEVCAALQAVASQWFIHYEESLDGAPGLSRIRAAWQARLATTQQLLQRIIGAAQFPIV